MPKRKFDSIENISVCHSCHQLSAHYDVVPGMSWAHQYSCYTCFEFWTVCTICSQYNIMNTSKKITIHNTQFHSVAIPEKASILSSGNSHDTNDVGNSYE